MHTHKSCNVNSNDDFWSSKLGRNVSWYSHNIKQHGTLQGVTRTEGYIETSAGNTLWVLFTRLTLDGENPGIPTAEYWVKQLGKQVSGKLPDGTPLEGKLLAVSLRSAEISCTLVGNVFKWVDLHTLSLNSESCCH